MLFLWSVVYQLWTTTINHKLYAHEVSMRYHPLYPELGSRSGNGAGTKTIQKGEQAHQEGKEKTAKGHEKDECG